MKRTLATIAMLLSARSASASTACCEAWTGDRTAQCLVADACAGAYSVPIAIRVADDGGLPCAANCVVVDHPTCCAGDCSEPDPALCAGSAPSCCAGSCADNTTCSLGQTAVAACCNLAGSITVPPLPAGFGEWLVEPWVAADAGAPEVMVTDAGDDAGALDVPPTLEVAPGCRCGAAGASGDARTTWLVVALLAGLAALRITGRREHGD